MVNKSLKNYRCNLCNKDYASSGSLWCHNNKFHSDTNIANMSGDIIKSSIDPKKCSNNVQKCSNNVQKCSIKKSLFCENCNKIFKNRSSKCMHKKKCTIENQIINNQIQNINNNNINNINNGTINNQKQIIINQIGKESISCLPMKDILKILGDGNNMPITCIKKLNFNKNIPENHSFCTTTLEGKHFTRINHETQKPEKINKIDFINEVLTSSLRFISNISFMTEFDDDYREKIPLEYQEKMRYILDNQHKFCDVKTKKAFFNCINDMSYNFKDIILETWKLIQPVENEETESDGPPLIDEDFRYHSSSDEDD